MIAPSEAQWGRVGAVIVQLDRVDKEGGKIYDQLTHFESKGMLGDTGKKLLNELEEAYVF